MRRARRRYDAPGPLDATARPSPRCSRDRETRSRDSVDARPARERGQCPRCWFAGTLGCRRRASRDRISRSRRGKIAVSFFAFDFTVRRFQGMLVIAVILPMKLPLKKAGSFLSSRGASGRRPLDATIDHFRRARRTRDSRADRRRKRRHVELAARRAGVRAPRASRARDERRLERGRRSRRARARRVVLRGRRRVGGRSRR